MRRMQAVSFTMCAFLTPDLVFYYDQLTWWVRCCMLLRIDVFWGDTMHFLHRWSYWYTLKYTAVHRTYSVIGNYAEYRIILVFLVQFIANLLLYIRKSCCCCPVPISALVLRSKSENDFNNIKFFFLIYTFIGLMWLIFCMSLLLRRKFASLKKRGLSILILQKYMFWIKMFQTDIYVYDILKA